MITKKRIRLRYDKTLGLLLISPWLIGFVLFKLIPILASLAISFTNFHLPTPKETIFIGIENYANLFHDDAVGYVLFQTIALGLSTVPFQVAVSIFLAALLSNPRLKAGNLMRILFFLPSIIPSVSLFFMLFGFVDPNSGWLNKLILEPLGLTGFDNVFSDQAIALLFSVSSLWAIGPSMLIMLGALLGLPPEVHEAARVDGAGPLVTFFYITVPLISHAIFFSIIINLIAVFGGVILLDRGGVFSNSYSPYDGYVYYVLFQRFDLGYASSLAWFFFILVMFVVAALFSSARRWVYYPDRDV